MSKSQDSRCRAVYVISQSPSVSTFIPHAAPPPNPIHASCALSAAVPCDEYDTLVANNGAPNPVAPVDYANVTDADAFEAGDYPSMAIFPDDQANVNDATGAPEQEDIQIDVENSAAGSTIVIDQFPFGSPGAPIPGVPEGFSTYQSCMASHPDSIWAPFLSECDWEFARWAKMRGPTSTAVTDLLAIPGVWAQYFHYYVTKSTVFRL